jgi:prolyl oligopeptidase
MKKLVTLFSLVGISFATSAQVKFNPPATPRIPVVDTLHGVILTDDYGWLEDKTDPRVIEWTKAQHDYGVNIKCNQKCIRV